MEPSGFCPQEMLQVIGSNPFVYDQSHRIAFRSHSLQGPSPMTLTDKPTPAIVAPPFARSPSQLPPILPRSPPHATSHRCRAVRLAWLPQPPKSISASQNEPSSDACGIFRLGGTQCAPFSVRPRR